MRALEFRAETIVQELDCRGVVDGADSDRIHGLAFRRAYQPNFISHTSFPAWSESGWVRSVASLHPEGGAFRRLFHFEFFLVSGLASYATFAVGAAVGAALGCDRFPHVRRGGES